METSPRIPELRTNGIQNMSLRDYFAAKAMQQTIKEFDKDWSTHAYEQTTFLTWAAERAYAIADAMLRARDA